MEIKDFVINAKNNTIEEIKPLKANKAENVAMKQELDHHKKEGTQQVAFTCKVCFRNLRQT